MPHGALQWLEKGEVDGRDRDSVINHPILTLVLLRVTINITLRDFTTFSLCCPGPNSKGQPFPSLPMSLRHQRCSRLASPSHGPPMALDPVLLSMCVRIRLFQCHRNCNMVPPDRRRDTVSLIKNCVLTIVRAPTRRSPQYTTQAQEEALSQDLSNHQVVHSRADHA
ncbi:hypothetical protein PSPO01_01541 [Paraphaeosphaeria sporulosa]